MSGAYAGGFQGFPETSPDSESLPFYVLAMQTLLRKGEIIFNTVASRCVADVRSVYRSAMRACNNCELRFSPRTQLLKRAKITQLLKSQSTRNAIIIIFTTHLHPVLCTIHGLCGNIEVS